VRKGWTHCRLGNATIKVMALPKMPDAVYLKNIFFREV
jgi:hypothetical protein